MSLYFGEIGHFKSIEDLLDLLARGGRGFINPGLTLQSEETQEKDTKTEPPPNLDYHLRICPFCSLCAAAKMSLLLAL